MNCYFWTAYLSWYAEITVVEPEINNYACVVKGKVTPQSKYQSHSRPRGKIPRIRYFDMRQYSSFDFDYRYVTYFTLIFLSSLHKYFLFCC